MKTILLTLAGVILSTICFGQVNPISIYINGYYKSNGTYVQGYYRTVPNNTINDNYSTYPNVNPHTRKQGTVSPESSLWNSTPNTSNSIPSFNVIFPKTQTNDLFNNSSISYDPIW